MDEEYGAYDPTILTAATGLPDGDVTTEDAQTGVVFDERHRQEFTGLVYLGALTKTFSLLGHTIVVRTLKDAERLAVALLVKPYMGTIGESKAYTQAWVAQAVVSVDGRELPYPLGEGDQVGSWAEQRFNWVGEQWYPTVTGAIYTACLELEAKVDEVVDAMGKASGRAA